MTSLFLFAAMLGENLPTGPGPYHLAGGDLNRDGFTDVVIACRGDLLLPSEKKPANDTVTVYLTNGSPELTERREWKVGFGPYTSIVKDIDGDGFLDVGVVNFQANDGRDLAIFWGEAKLAKTPEAEFIKISGRHVYDKQRAATGEPIYAVPGLTSVAAADVNGDGKMDLVAVAWSSDFFVVLTNLGNRRFSQKMFRLPPGPRDVTMGDFNRDGIADLAFSIYSSNLVEVWCGDGKGSFRQTQSFHSQGHIPYHLKAADIDRDGYADIVVGNRGPSDNIALFRNQNGRFQFVGSFRTDTAKHGETTADEIRDVLLHDWDGDGKLDLLAAGHLSHKVIVWLGSGATEFGRAFGRQRSIDFPGKGPRALLPVGKRVGVVFFDANEFGWVK